MPTPFPATLAQPGSAPALRPVRLAQLTPKQLEVPPPRLLVDCGGQLLPHPLGVCRFVALLLLLRLRGARIWLCNVHPVLCHYLHQLKLGALFHLTARETPARARVPAAAQALLT